MAIKHSTLTLVIAQSATVAATTGSGPADTAALRFDQALQRLQTGQWQRAYAELSALASAGHPPAARIALMLARRGTSLFGGRFAATREERARWQRHGGA